jgi:hypothetical protein
MKSFRKFVEKKREKIRLTYKQITKDGQEYSDGEDFDSWKDAVDTMNAYLQSQNWFDTVEEYWWWDDNGNEFPMVVKGKTWKKKFKLKDVVK